MYKDWELHVHNKEAISICKWDEKTNTPVKKLEITKDSKGLSMKLLIWNKCLPLSSFPEKIEASSFRDAWVKRY